MYTEEQNMLIHDYLQENTTTKYQLARMAGLPYGTLNDIIRGKTDIAKCTGETLMKIADALGCTVDDLLKERFCSSGFDLNRIRTLVAPIAKRHKLRSVYVFGSYARNEATEDSDVDLLIDREGSSIHGIFGMNALLNEFRETLGKDVDLVTLQSLRQENTIRNNSDFIESVMKEKVKIYG